MRKLENKFPPPLIMIISALLMWIVSYVSSTLEIQNSLRYLLITLALATSVFFVFAALLSFRRVKTTLNPRMPSNASSLVTSGIYRISRNPMYVSMALILTAWAIFLSTTYSIIGIFAFIAYINRFQIIPEERALQSLFGSEFENYKKSVRRWI